MSGHFLWVPGGVVTVIGQDPGAEVGPRDYSDQVAALLRTDVQGMRDLLVRRIVVGMGGVALWLTLESYWFLAWGVGYTVFDMAYIRGIRATSRLDHVRLSQYLPLISAQVFVSLWVSLMVIYAATFETPEIRFIAFCGIVGLGLHGLTNNYNWSHVAVSNLANVAIVVVGTTIQTALYSEQVSHISATLLIGAGLLGYYIHCYVDIIATREKLDETREAEAQSERLRAVGQLTAGVAHDFNNILTVIRGNLDLIDVLNDPVEKASCLEEARTGSDRAAHLVRQLLAYSQKSPLQCSEVDLAEFLKDSAQMLSRVLPASIRIVHEPPRDDISLRVDASLLGTAVLNAVLNARDAMHPDPGEIRLRVLADAKEIAILIEDSGTGIPAPLLSKAAEPFWTTKAVGEGSGLGLPMIKGFAEQSGGRLELANRAEGGLSVQIILPRTGCDAVPGQTAQISATM